MASELAETARAALPRIYVASLSDYNAGILHGTWIDLDGDRDGLWGQVNAMLASSPAAHRYNEVAEEWAIHDYERFGSLRLGEYEDLDALNAIAQLTIEHGSAFLAWLDRVGVTEAAGDDASERFEDAFHGHHDSPEAYGEALLDDLGIDLEQGDAIPEFLRPYVQIDVKGLVRDMELNGEIDILEAEEGGVHVFWTR